MDKQNDETIPHCPAPGSIPEGKLLIGIRQIRKALQDGRVTQVLLAKDADPALTDPLAAMCRDSQVACCYVPTRKALGRACGIDVGTAAAAVVD